MAKQSHQQPTPFHGAAKKLSIKEIEERRLEISRALGGVKVHACCYEEDPEHGQVLVFLREPSLQMKLRALDSIGVGADNVFGTGSTLLEALIIKEHSDTRVLSGNPDFDQYYVALTAEAIGLCKAASNIIKKK